MGRGHSVRPAHERDVASIIDITNREIREGTAHFGTAEDSVDDGLRLFEARCHYPWFVAVDPDDRVIGFARAGRWDARGGYDWTTMIAVYVKPERHGGGVGRSLYAELFPAVEALGLRTIIAGIALPNPASVRLHESFGMVYAGVFPRAGFKHGRWIDVAYWVRHLGEGPPQGVSPTIDATTTRD